MKSLSFNDLNHIGLFVAHSLLDFNLLISAVKSANLGILILPFQVHNLAVQPTTVAK